MPCIRFLVQSNTRHVDLGSYQSPKYGEGYGFRSRRAGYIKSLFSSVPVLIFRNIPSSVPPPYHDSKMYPFSVPSPCCANSINPYRSRSRTLRSDSTTFYVSFFLRQNIQPANTWSVRLTVITTATDVPA